MMSLQHVICTLIRWEGNMENFKRELPYCVLPDAVRVYLGERTASHFEVNPERTDNSYYHYPADIKNLTKEKALMQERHIAPTNLKSVIGERSDISSYILLNRDLPTEEYYGILTHLLQDLVFDIYLRSRFDNNHKYGEDAYFTLLGTNERFTPIEYREILAQIEEYGYYYLARYCYQIYGITIDQDWLDENVYPTLLEAYPKDLADNTYKYMHLPSWLNEKITNHEFRELKIPVLNEDYSGIYNLVMQYTKDLHTFNKKKTPEKTDPPKQRAA